MIEKNLIFGLNKLFYIMALGDFKATIEVLDENGNPVIVPVSMNIDHEVSQEIKLDFTSTTDGGPILTPKTPRI